MFKYFTEFYKQALYHFLTSALCATLFALGLEYSKGSERETDTPYFMPAMVLSGMHFILTVVSMLAFYYARSLSEIYDGVRRWDNSEKHFRRLKPLYLILLYPCFIWSIVGAALAGQTGICSTDERPCYYSVNKWQNRAVAIVIIVIHVLNGVVTMFILTTRHKIKREIDDYDVVDKNRKGAKDTQSLSFNQQNFVAKRTNQEYNTENKIKLSLIKDPQPPRRELSNVGMTSINSSKSRESGNDKRVLLPPIKQPIKRHLTDGNIRLVHSDYVQNGDSDLNKSDLKPLPRRISNHNRHPSENVIGNLRIVAPKHRSASFVQPKNKPLYKYSDTSSSNESDGKAHRRHKKKVPPKRRMTEQPKVPPPSYNQVQAPSGTDPYWLPPIPQHDNRMDYIPENMYSGHSFPDAELVPVYPNKVPKAQWQISD